MVRKKRVSALSGTRCGTFIDVFAGCGGLSLGLMLAGWKGLFAVEKDAFAFETLKCNLIDRKRDIGYIWPTWLPAEPCEVSTLIKTHRNELINLRGHVDLIAGGPPCQGFSLAGKREANDPRNELFRYYVELISLVQPKLLLLENVRGIEVGHGTGRRSQVSRSTEEQEDAGTETGEAFSKVIKRALEDAGYHVYTVRVRAADFGVPQWRPRFLMIGVRKDLLRTPGDLNVRQMIEVRRIHFLANQQLPLDRHITVWEAISDLEIDGKELEDCIDSPRAKQIKYIGPRSHYQRLLRVGTDVPPNSLRLPMHRDETRHRFWWILKSCRHGKQLSDEDRRTFGLNKHCIVPLNERAASHTLTTLPDDLLHYSEPRNLTVRENARLQSFPDWYEFKGAYCTGGKRRVQQCPRYTQVGNAVPPFLSQAIGLTMGDICEHIHRAVTRRAIQITMRPNRRSQGTPSAVEANVAGLIGIHLISRSSADAVALVASSAYC